jgi:hypothetical protein
MVDTLTIEARSVQQLLCQTDLFVNWLRNRPRNEIVGTDDECPVQRFLAGHEHLLSARVVVDSMLAEIYPQYGYESATILLPEWAQLLSSVLDEKGEITAGRCLAGLRVTESIYRRRTPARARRVFAGNHARGPSLFINAAVTKLVNEYLPCVTFLADDLLVGNSQAAVERYISETMAKYYDPNDVRAAARVITHQICNSVSTPTA